MYTQIVCNLFFHPALLLLLSLRPKEFLKKKTQLKIPSSRSIGRGFFLLFILQNQTVYRRSTDVRYCQLLPGKRIHLPVEGAVAQPQYSLYTSQCIYLCQSSYTFVVVVVYYHFPGHAVICRAVVVIRVTAIRPRSTIDPDATRTWHGFFKIGTQQRHA